MKRIFLLGYMGVGKTTIGKELSTRLNLTFLDLDHHIEARYHKTISLLFAEKGEDEFRRIEYRMLRETAMFEDILISTGGGTPCFFDNMAFMNRVGETVYLKASPEELANRLDRIGANRPVLEGRKGEDLRSFISENLEKRAPFYLQAQIIFDAGKLYSPNDVKAIVDGLEKILLK
jgi:shikimate kinase